MDRQPEYPYLSQNTGNKPLYRDLVGGDHKNKQQNGKACLGCRTSLSGQPLFIKADIQAAAENIGKGIIDARRII